MCQSWENAFGQVTIILVLVYFQLDKAFAQLPLFTGAAVRQTTVYSTQSIEKENNTLNVNTRNQSF